jgi:hypothetical protein
MNLNEAIVEDAALEWFGELGYAVGHGPHLAPGEPAAERGAKPKGSCQAKGVWPCFVSLSALTLTSRF